MRCFLRCILSSCATGFRRPREQTREANVRRSEKRKLRFGTRRVKVELR